MICMYTYKDELAISRYNTYHLRICKDWLSFLPSICNRSPIIINYKIISIRILSFFVFLIKVFCFRTMTFLWSPLFLLRQNFKKYRSTINTLHTEQLKNLQNITFLKWPTAEKVVTSVFNICSDSIN